jgi:hypothetical protein
MVVVFGDFEHAFARDVPATQHIFEEGDDVLVLLRSAEGDEEEGVIFNWWASGHVSDVFELGVV